MYFKIGVTGYIGLCGVGLVFKEVVDKVGKLIYLELSSINLVVILFGVLVECGVEIVEEFVSSCFMGIGQFCTNLGVLFLFKGESIDVFFSVVGASFAVVLVGTLFMEVVENSMECSFEVFMGVGVEVL